MGAITRSVGAGGANRPADVTEIQQLLNKIPAAKGGAAPPFVVFGTCDSATLAAILKFQKMQVPAFADGRVDPGGPTLTKMNALAGPPGPGPTPAAKGSATDVARARGIAQTWLTAVEPSITGFIFSVSKGLTYAQAPSLAFIEDAFHKHFKLILNASKKDAAHPNTKVFTPGSDKTFLPVIRANFRAIQGVVLNQSKFDLITAATAAPGIAAYVKATGGNIQVSPAFNSPARGPNCQAAIVVHEATHVVDGASGADPAHIPEWATNDPPISGKVSPGPGAKFGKTGYDLQTPEDAIHNAAAYASFAAHVARGKDERFGDGRQTE